MIKCYQAIGICIDEIPQCCTLKPISTVNGVCIFSICFPKKLFRFGNTSLFYSIAIVMPWGIGVGDLGGR